MRELCEGKRKREEKSLFRDSVKS